MRHCSPALYGSHGETFIWGLGAMKYIILVNYVSVNYAIRFSCPVTALTARRLRYGVGPDLICQPGPTVLSPGIKKHSSPAAFPTTLSSLLFPSPLLPSCTAPSCLRPRRTPLTPLPGPLIPT